MPISDIAYFFTGTNWEILEEICRKELLRMMVNWRGARGLYLNSKRFMWKRRTLYSSHVNVLKKPRLGSNMSDATVEQHREDILGTLHMYCRDGLVRGYVLVSVYHFETTCIKLVHFMKKWDWWSLTICSKWQNIRVNISRFKYSGTARK